jgi:hypothetical protein
MVWVNLLTIMKKIPMAVPPVILVGPKLLYVVHLLVLLLLHSVKSHPHHLLYMRPFQTQIG